VVSELTSDIELDLGSDEAELALLAPLYPCLLQRATADGLELRGMFPVLDGDQEVDAFKVRIDLKRCGEFFAPAVFEIGGRIPKDMARHVNTADGSVCVALPEDIWLATRGEPMRLSAFLDGPVRSFFLAQLIFDRDGRWPFGDRGHGSVGVCDFYQELLGTRDLRVAGRYVAMLAEPKWHRQWLCPCGSGEKLRRCHRELLDGLRERVPPKVAVILGQRLRKMTTLSARSSPSSPRRALT
jgi:hypothetical protein